MRLTVVGCSPAWPNPGGAHAGYLLESGGRRLLVDCGPGVLSRLRAAEGWPAVDAIAITHCHLDHCGDLVAWIWGLLTGPGRGHAAPPLWLPPGGREAVRALAGDTDPGGVFQTREYADRTAFEAAGFRVLPIRVPHFTQLAFGLRIDDGSRTVAFSGDSGPSPALAELARDADLFVCEATLAEPPPQEERRGHLTADEAVSAGAGARRLLLTHRPVELAVPPGLEVAREGLALEL